MNFQIVLSDEARESVKQASEYYIEISTSLQGRFQADLVETID